ncbi:MAG TPA: hypothetical protein VD948_08800 [Rhodothermales bacterium]|nr:hypothetical protein [Rhodothermales bacterium]
MTRFAKWVWRTRRSVAFGPGGSTFMDLPDTGKFSLRYWPRWMQSRGRDWHPLIGCGLEASVNPENVDLPGKLYVRRIIQASSGGVKSAALTPTPGRGEAEGQAGEQED